MDPRLLIASRIDLHLRRHLDQGIDVQRALSDAPYAREMLWVCDAMRNTRLPLLAHQFRQAESLMARGSALSGRDAGPPQDWSAQTSGFGVSRPPLVTAPRRSDAEKPWFSPSRWFEA